MVIFMFVDFVIVYSFVVLSVVFCYAWLFLDLCNVLLIYCVFVPHTSMFFIVFITFLCPLVCSCFVIVVSVIYELYCDFCSLCGFRIHDYCVYLY